MVTSNRRIVVPHPPERRRFLALLGAALPLLTPPSLRRRRRPPHPEPRPGIDGSHVLTARDLADTPEVVPIFDMIRQIPRVADGIRCQCECAELPEFYSLLSCYEQDGMARHCHICQGVARLVYRSHKQGRTLNQIRAAVDAATWG
jgi:hypothetical protein